MTDAGSVDACRWMGIDGAATAHTIAAFLTGVGIRISFGPVDAASLLPGMTVARGVIRIDPAVEAWPGDLLHEAGHIAVTDPAERDACETISDDPAEEMAAIAWSVAAARACGVPLDALFIDAGYRGGAASMRDAFAGDAAPFGVPMLAWWGMTADPARAAPGEAAFPAMARWLR